MTSSRAERRQRSLRLDAGLPARPGASRRRELGVGGVVPIVIPAQVLAAQMRHNELVPGDTTAAICGDPLPGQSALERVAAPVLTLAQKAARMFGQGGVTAALSPREKRRLRIMAAITRGEG